MRNGKIKLPAAAPDKQSRLALARFFSKYLLDQDLTIFKLAFTTYRFENSR